MRICHLETLARAVVDLARTPEVGTGGFRTFMVTRTLGTHWLVSQHVLKQGGGSRNASLEGVVTRVGYFVPQNFKCLFLIRARRQLLM